MLRGINFGGLHENLPMHPEPEFQSVCRTNKAPIYDYARSVWVNVVSEVSGLPYIDTGRGQAFRVYGVYRFQDFGCWYRGNAVIVVFEDWRC